MPLSPGRATRLPNADLLWIQPSPALDVERPLLTPDSVLLRPAIYLLTAPCSRMDWFARKRISFAHQYGRDRSA